MVSPSGLGATTLLKHVSTNAGFDDCAIEAVFTSGRFPSVERTFAGLAQAMGISPRRDPLGAITLAIDNSRRQSLRFVWLVDGIGKHSAEAVADITRRRLPISVIATVSPSLLRLVNRSIGEKPRTELARMNESDTSDYVNHSLQYAGRRREVFDTGAVAMLHELSRGSIREISRLAQLTLTHASNQGLAEITKTEVKAVHQAMRAA